MGRLLRTKPLALLTQDTEQQETRLRRSLRAIDLIAVGIGCMVGMGIFVLPGIEAATNAGPGVVLSFFAIAAVACACSALCYAELAAMIPVSGSAYTYGYATLGEIFGWIIGWDLLLEYMLGASLVSISWSGYVVNMIDNALAPLGWQIPQALTSAPFGEHPGILNLPAAIVVFAICALLVRGIKESARVNLAVVILKVAVIFLFLGVASWYVNPTNWKPFMPFGFKGVLASAAIVFIAYIGFDAVSTTAEEAVNPQRDLPIGILGSLAITTLLYMTVALIMTGVVHYSKLGVDHPVAFVLDVLHKPWASMIVSVGGIVGMTSVILVLLLGQPRILFAMSRDGLLPPALSRVHARYRTPHVATIVTSSIVAVVAAFTPIKIVEELVSIGTLGAFLIVSAGVLILRYTRPEIRRPFRTPLFPVIPVLGVLLCGGLMTRLPWSAWERFLVWLAIGLAVYFLYGMKHSKLNTAPPAGEVKGPTVL